MRFISTKLGRAFLSLIIVMTVCNMAKATTDPIITKPLLGSLGKFKVDSVSYAKDMKYFSMSAASRNAIQNNSILNMVGVGIEEHSGYYIRSNFSVTVTLQIITYNSSEVATGTYNKTFTVNYDTAAGAKYKSLDYTTYSDAFALRAKIISIDSGNINWPVSNVLKVENQLTATRDYSFNCNLAIEGLNTNLSAANNELTAGWTQPSLDDNAGVTEYDLEWAWVDEGALAGYKNGNNFVQDLVFTNNATRVSISGSSYNIPLLYDDTGRIFVRVRPVQLRTDGQRIEGRWNWIFNDANQPVESINPVFYTFYGHEDKLNWQASTSFAEEGKRKSVIQYFDGSLRNRQTITKDNTSNTTVVAESFYDYQGRAIVQVLPAPTLNTAIAYVKNFNQAIGYNEYPKSVYDKLDANTTVCSNPAKPFNTDFGTANYYSAKNPMLPTDALAKYIPDATAGNPNEAYSFTETRLSPDGRVAAQGGVGSTYQLGSGHETKYYYEPPAQEELDALLGTDAGVASHYFKNIVRDANGQFSVSYVDMHGRTVATALAGEVPKNVDNSPMLDTLESKNEQTFTKQLIDKETNIVLGNSIISSKPIVVMKDNSTYTFDYSLSPKQLSLISCSTNQPICYDCLYQLKFTISSDCDMQLVYLDSSINFTLGEYINQCNANGNSAQGFLKHFDKILNIGSYTVTKVLSLSSEAQTAYRNKFLQTDTCKKLIDFYNEELALLQSTSNCAITCQSCKAALGNDLNGFIAKFAAEMNVAVVSLSPETIAQLTTSYNEAMTNCERICTNTDGMNLIRSTREIMLQDVTPPYGQYARPDAASVAKSYNIFKTGDGSNTLSGYGINTTQPDYMQPRSFATNDITLLNSGSYFNEFNQPETIQPGTLTSQQFIDSFKTPWANQLLVHHPEYKKLQLSENQLKPAYEFEAFLEKDTTWAQAALPHALYGNYRFITNLVDADPFFSGVGATYRQRMIDGKYLGANQPPTTVILDIDPVIHGITNYVLPHTVLHPNPQTTCPNAPQYDDEFVSMWQVAIGSVFCRDKADGDPCSLLHTDLNTKAGCTMNPTYAQPAYNFSEGCATDRDWAWKIFKTLYLAERRKLIAAYLNANAASFSQAYPNNGTPPYQQRFINHANPSTVFTNLGIADAGNIGDIINTAGNNMSGGTQQSQVLAQQQYDTVCRGYANVWISQLKSCPGIAQRLNNPAYWTADSAWLVSNLVAVCRKGSDENHYLGSSSVSPVNQNTIIINGVQVNNFEDVIRIYMDQNSPYPPVAHPTSECYEWLINTPKPYDKQKAITYSYVLTKPSPCECERLSDLRMDWTNSGFTGTFSAWMQYQHGTYISDEQLDAMTALCTGNYQCHMLEKPILLPSALQCPSSYPNPAPKTCISCADYAAIKVEFNTLTGQQAPFVSPQNTTEVNWNYAFANYANNKTGFSKTWMEYVAFQNTCNANNPTISCGSLDSTLNVFLASPEYLGNPIGLPCIQAFVNYFNSHYNVVYTYAGWQQVYAQGNCNFPNVCRPKINCSSFTAMIESFYSQYGVQVFKNTSCSYLFVNFINMQLGSNYTYAQLEAIYNYTCGGTCGLNICTFPNHFLLTRVYNQFKIDNPHPWTLPDCLQAFADYFNNYFGLNPALDLSTILSYYPVIDRACTPDITSLCVPPYTCSDLQNIVNRFLADPANQPISQLPNCQQKFADFFNLVLGTNYTYAQIAAIYLSICGTALNVCQTNPDCKQMLSLYQYFLNNRATICNAGSYPTCAECFVSYYNSQFGTNYATAGELTDYYAQHCGYTIYLLTCSSGFVSDQTIISTESFNSFVDNFKTDYPDPATQLGADCLDYFGAKFNEQFQTSYTCAEIATYYQQQTGKELDVCNSQCSKVTAFITGFLSQYGNLTLPTAAREDLFTFVYNYNFLNGAIPKPAASPSDLAVSADAKDLNPAVDYKTILEALADCGYSNFNLNIATTASINNPQVLLSLKQVYYITHPNGLPDNCQTDFASWFNTVMKTQYEYADLLALYNNVCGNNAGYICEPPADVNAEASIYVNIVGPNVPPANLPPMLCGLNDGGPVPIEHDPCKDLPKIAFHFAQEKYELYVDSLRNVFDAAYREKCLAAKDLESFTVTYRTSEYHYTLYYYDQAGNLVKTVPPAGVQKLSGNDLVLVKNYRANVLNGQPEAGNEKFPLHKLITQYRYNTLGQVLAQVTPDGGLSKFYYDRLGRLVVSQNAKQAVQNNYSYTLYDNLGRITEVGQKPHTQPMIQTISQSQTSLSNWFAGGGVKEQMTKTVYDVAYTPLQVSTAANGGFYQKNLRNRVSYSYIKNTDSNDPDYPWNAATLFSYDIHGNVDTLLQDYGSSASSLSANAMNTNGNRWKRIVYNYDLTSGKVNSVAYQPGAVDAFYYRYSYDAENKLILAEVSLDKVVWERIARYYYYKHGALANTVFGEQQVQQIKNAYTIQGWTKGIIPETTPDVIIAKQAFSYGLGYFANDYKAIGIVNPFTSVNKGNDLFNGNIKAMFVNIPKLGEPVLHSYTYDQLNRIKQVNNYNNYNAVTNTWQSTAAHKEALTFDANGNIQTAMLNGSVANLPYENFTYNYDAVKKNRLLSMTNSINSTTKTYQYDEIGNVTKDELEDNSTIEWNVYGKLKKIIKLDGSNIQFGYDYNCNQISKTIDNNVQWMVRDAQGNILATYKKDMNVNNNKLSTEGYQMYGSNLIGSWNKIRDVETLGANNNTNQLVRGEQSIYIGNHLGNNSVILNDKKIGISSNNNTVDFYIADVINAADYSAYGENLIGREYNGNGIKFGFNGKLNNIETGYQDYGMRMFSNKAKRFICVDFLTGSYPELTPYQYASNRPLDGVDLDGAEYLTYYVNLTTNSKGNTYISKTTVAWNNPNSHNSYGNKGKGVQYVFYFNEEGKKPTCSRLSFVSRQATAGIPIDHGNYMGPSSLYKFTSKGDFIGDPNPRYDYSLPAVDAIDEYSKKHDMAYDALKAVGGKSLYSDWGTVYADEDAAIGYTQIASKNANDKDPFNGQKIGSEQISMAKNASFLFNKIVSGKKTMISDFMMRNYKTEAADAHKGMRDDGNDGYLDARDENVQLFFTKYMKVENGQWIRNESMWKKDSKGNYTPKKPSEIKKN